MENSGPQIIVTKDGSHSLLNAALNETYHSVHGALQESRHVFIEHGLISWFNQQNHNGAAILEVGFGTGLNALLTADFATKSQKKIDYTTIEAFPLSKEIWNKLNYAETVGTSERFDLLHECSWDEPFQVNPWFCLKKLKTTLQLLEILPEQFDVIFFDAFAPSKQPEMWTVEMLSKVTNGLRSGGIFVTYCAKGQLKRDLSSLGLAVETLAGPPGKKEMVRATRR